MQKPPMHGGPLFRYLPYVVAGIYALFSTLWITLSDRYVASLSSNPARLNDMQTHKGLAFITLSALLILFVLRYAWSRVFAAYNASLASERRLQLALSSAAGGVWELEIGGDETEAFISPDLVERLGFPRSRHLTLGELSRMRHPDDVAETDEAFATLIEGGTNFLDTRYRIFGADGACRWMQTRCTVVRDQIDQPPRLIGVSLDITDQVQAQERVDELLRFDPHTGLAKPQKLLADTDEVLKDAPDSVLGVVRIKLLDLGRFVGESETDDDARIVREFAERLHRLADRRGLAARISTNAFAFATPALADKHAVHQFVQTAVELLSAPVEGQPDGGRLRLAAGGAMFPQDGSSADTLLRNAGHALCTIATGETGIDWFTEGLDVEFRERNERLRELEAAVGNGEIECHFQPLVDLSRGRTAGFEALARWHRPGHGLVGPDRFIPLAEEFGHIGAIGEAVLRQACSAAAGWEADDDRALLVAVNISPLQISDPAFPALVARVLAKTGLAPERLELEVTESAVMRDPDAAAKALQELAALGVSVAIDDFGTGHSSLSLLARLPFTRLKIDRTFIAAYGEDEQTTAISDTIIELARRLGLGITAEGVESGLVARLLTRRGVELAQGYAFSRPLPATEAAKLASMRWTIPADGQHAAKSGSRFSPEAAPAGSR